jgi:hypothetical protein
MLEGKIEKESPLAWQRQMKSAVDGAAGDVAGERVG